MANPQLHLFVRRLRTTLGPESAGLTDGQLLERFVTSRDQAAFEVLMWRHGPMVLGVCARLLPNEQDAEDVFQATFLTLARKAGSIGKREALGGWLHTTACRAALRARVRGAQQTRMQGLPGDIPAPKASNEDAHDLRPLLDEEIARLPLKYRLPVLFVYLQGRTTAEAAQQLGCPRGTVCSRLAWARDRLRSRLLRRGFTFAGTVLVTALSQAPAKAVPAGLVQATLKGALAFAAGQVTVGAISTQAAILAQGVLKAMFVTKLKLFACLLLALSVMALGTGLCLQRAQADKESPDAVPQRVAGDNHAIRVPADMVVPLGIQVAEVQRRAARPPNILRLTGSLALDPERLLRIHSRFAGEVVEIGKVEEAGANADPVMRAIRVGSQVRKGQLLAVVWSKELGEKKAELVDALLRLHLDRPNLTRVEELFKQGVITEENFQKVRRDFETDQNAVTRAERTLRILRLSEEEIKAVKEEAQRISERKGKRDEEREKNWARVEIRAPLDGTVVERNISQGEIVDPASDLFKIANLDRLLVLANVAEADLAALLAQLAVSKKGTVQAVGGPPIEAKIEEVSPTLDPNLNTALVKGSIDNPGHKLRAGQFIHVSIALPVPAGELVVPAAAIVEDAKASFVFVQPDPKQFVYRQRRVLVVRRGHDVVHIRSPLSLEEERQGFQSLRPGERILTGGVVELKATMDDLKTREKP